MASKYLQKYPIPAGFPEILSDFARQVLRDQPPNIIDYAAKYFQMLEKGKKLEFDSKNNIKKQQKKYELAYNPKKAQEITKKASNIAAKVSGSKQDQKQEEAEMDEQQRLYQQKTNQLVDTYYEYYDENKNGFLEVEEINKMAETACKNLGHGMPNEEQLKRFREQLDIDGDGRISKEQFKREVYTLINYTNRVMRQ